MKLALDAHAWIWFDSESKNLPDAVRQAINDRNNQIFLSTATVWEIQIKVQLKKLSLRLPSEELIADHREKNAFRIQDIKLEHIYELQNLPDIHGDPFDRLLIASDRMIQRYDVPILW